ncbi:SusC/RagA family TonB-linked outer membrane protein [Hymenobacter sp. BT683]|uniref:SusC/RagA family TonB-linked outer membrane protein n=1 Tax=Hymenobacter jeongseonensis TaxID=2791027 RepID=A0ABS0IJA8_9BACT|nr:SusC/RagA family TonB-linked outer membrane protein [Hymenobacter jeongseonensis]MBF9238242.1 SusC/RagA family TonB-linked outer membrane protein [Hymenobacter jeongseonensis]
MKKLLCMVMLLMTGLLQQVYAQERSLTGRVTDRTSGQGLPGATVLVKGTTIGASTNADGSFTLSVPASATTITISSIGFTSVEQPIGNDSNFTISLASDVKQLGEVVVTGALGIQRQQQQVGYATATIDTKELTQARVTNVANGLAGKVSGLQISTLNNSVTAAPRITLRGSRSLTGNNEALVVIDGVISTNEVLGALNPDDVASIDVLKGANAAALYGSQASNGALIITTKKGGSNSQVTFSHTSQFESISFLPKFQTEFGPGSPDWFTNSGGEPFEPDNKVDDEYHHQYQGFENQQYGPRFDGSMRPFGQTLADGSVQMLSYEARPDEKRDFFNTGYQVQNGVTFSGGDEKTKFFTSYQNLQNQGIVPGDKFGRNSFRFNASREIGRLNIGFNLSYSLQKANYTSNLDRNTSVYWNVFNTSVMAPLTSYKDYRNDKFSEPNYGYYNAYYYNPYFIIDANRTTDRRNTLQGNIDVTYKLTDWLRANYRIGTTNINQANIDTQNKFTLDANSPKQIGSYPGFVRDLTSAQNRTNSDLFLSMDKTFGDISVQAILGNNVQVNTSRFNYVASTALAVPVVGDAFNLSNRVGNLDGANARAESRLIAFYGDLTLGYKDFFYLHGSGRQDNISILDSDNQSFFYPGVDASFIFTNAVPVLKELSFLDYGKIRGGITKVSQVNLGGATANGVYNSFGAYRLNSTFSNGTGFPFGNLASFTANGGLVQPGLKPEDTRSIETGIELSFLQRRVSTAVTYYAQKSTNQTVTTSISGTSGYQSLLLNAGEVQNRGVEIDLNITPIRVQDGLTVTVGGNYNFNENEVVSLPNGLSQLNLTGSGRQSTNADLFAIPGQAFPVLQGTYYQRTEDGRVKMVKVSDPNDATLERYAPLIASDQKIFGNTQPKHRYGMNTSISYKGLTLAGQGELRTGYVVYNTIGENLDFTGGGQRSAQYGRQDFVYPNSAVPVTDAGGNVTYVSNTSKLTPGGSEFWANNPTWNTGVAENYVTTGKFFKIRELSLGYSLPTALVSKLGLVKGASFNVFGRNIFTWVPKENIYTDPEFSGTAIGSNAVGINSVLQTPPTKFYGATLNVTL